MDTTVLTPGPNQTVVATSREQYDCNGRYFNLDPLLLSEQAAYGRQASEEAHRHMHALGQSAAATQAAVGSVGARVERGFADTSDRIYEANRDNAETIRDSSRDVMHRVTHGTDAVREDIDRFQHDSRNAERHQLDRLRDVELRLLETENRTLRRMDRGHARIEARSQELAYEAQLRETEHYAKLRATIKSEGHKTREQHADFRMRDLEAKIEYLHAKELARKDKD
jgi:hypothetical protein